MIRRLAREESGFTLIELLIASVLMLVIMGAAFGALQQFETNSNANARQNDAQDQARNALDLIIKRLRNDAAPTPGSPQAIDRATPSDLIFQSVDNVAAPAGSLNAHNLIRVRYCLDDSTLSNEKVWIQFQKWTTAATPDVPSSASCPDPGWGNSRVLVDHVTNDYGLTQRPLWTIDCPAGYSSAVCAAGTDQTMLAAVRRLGVTMYVDRNVKQPPSESRLSSGVFFRNQNAAPTAGLTANAVAGHIYADASPSSDPDANRLYYRWCYYGTAAPLATWCANGTEIQQHTSSIDYVPTPAQPGATVTVGLRVEDQGGLVAYASKQVVLR